MATTASAPSPSVPPAQAGDDLPPLSGYTLTEAAPDPAPGPLRERMAADAVVRAERDEAAVAAVVQDWLDMIDGVARARVSGPKGRRGTKFWTPGPREQIEYKADGSREYKAIDGDYVVPDRLDELGAALRPVGMRIVRDGARGVADRLGSPELVGDSSDPGDPDGGGMFAFDVAELDAAVEDAIAEMLGVADGHARALREAITGADADADTLDEVIDAIAAAQRRGGAWMLLRGRTLANALRNRSELDTARAVGVTHTQWLSRRDARVRHTHVLADGQVRPVGEGFAVGGFSLEFPGDPTDLPASWGEIANCRCGLIMAWPDEATRAALREVEEAAADTEYSANLAAQRVHFAATRPDLDELAAIDAGSGPWPVTVLDEPVVGYRVLGPGPAMAPGQLMTFAAPVVLALRAPTEVTGATVLGVSLPAGQVIAAGPGAVALPAGTTLSVSGATDAAVVAVPLATAG